MSLQASRAHGSKAVTLFFGASAVLHVVALVAVIVVVAYDYRTQKSVPVPEDWRSIISEFEGRDFSIS